MYNRAMTNQATAGSTTKVLKRAFSICQVTLALYACIAFVDHGTVWAQEPIIGDAVTQSTQSTSTQATIPPNSLSGCGGTQLASSNLDLEARVLELVNQIRLDNGLLPLKRVPVLNDSARFHATDMGMDNYFSHNTHDRINDQLVEVCPWNDRVKSYYTNWGTMAENIAAGYKTPEAVVNAWMDSPGHRANILSEGNWEIGLGYFTGAGNYTHYWVQDFGRRRDIFPVILNAEAATTDAGDLTVYIYGEWQDVRFRIDEGGWSDWVAFNPIMNWRLEGDAGEHTVYVEMRNGGQVVTSSDSIHLVQSNRPAHLDPLPEELTFLYDKQQARLYPEMHLLQPVAQEANDHRWRAKADGNWLSILPNEGGAADVVEVRPVATSADSVAPGTTSLTLSLHDGDGAMLDSQIIEVSLQVLDESLNHVFIPTVLR